jgi:hypothetical protein
MSFGRFLFWFGIIPAGIALAVALFIEGDALDRAGYRRQGAIAAIVLIPLLVLLTAVMGYYAFCLPGAKRKRSSARVWAEILLTVLFLPWSLFVLVLLDERRRKRPVTGRKQQRSVLDRPLWALDGRLWWSPLATGWFFVGLCLLGVAGSALRGVWPGFVSVAGSTAGPILMIWATVDLRRRRRRILQRHERRVPPAPLPVSPPSSSSPAQVRPGADIDWTTPLLSAKARKAREEKLRQQARAEEGGEADG